MFWNKAYTASYYAEVVDKVTWKDVRRMEITSGQIERTSEDLRQSADISVTEDPGECIIRIYLEAAQNGDTERVALFTGLTTAPEKVIDGNRESYSVECYSVLKAADDILLQRGYYAPANLPAAEAAAKLLRVNGTPVVVAEDSPTLTESVIAEDGETNLSFAEKLIEAIGWEIVIDGDGTVNIRPPSDEVVDTFDALSNDVLQTSVTISNDWYSAPNVFRAVSDDLTAVAKDETDGDLSIESRGREIWLEETGVTLGDNESLAAYAMRRLSEEQAVAKTASYSRRFSPLVNVGDVVRIHYPGIIDGTGTVTSQSLSLGHSCTTSEEVTI